MKSLHCFASAVIATCFLTVAAFAADASPSGLWKWTVQGRQGGQGFEQTMKLELKDGKLTGTFHGRKTEQFTVPDAEISEASFKDGMLKFEVTREFNGNKFTTKYEGKIEGDSIVGSSLRPGFGDGDPVKSEWAPKRQK